MALSEEKAQQILDEVVKSNTDPEFKRSVKAVVYREDYQDYIVVLDNFSYCEIREKLISDYQQFKHADVVRELLYKLKHAVKLEEWQLEDMGLSGEVSAEDLAAAANQDGKGDSSISKDDDFKKKIAVDDSDKYDWLKD